MGRGNLKMWGRLAKALDLPSAAFLARWSTSLLPRMLLWLEIHLKVS